MGFFTAWTEGSEVKKKVEIKFASSDLIPTFAAPFGKPRGFNRKFFEKTVFKVQASTEKKNRERQFQIGIEKCQRSS